MITLPPIRIEPDAWYYEFQLRMAGLDEDDIRKARQDGSLRFQQLKQGRIYKGSWVIGWLEGRGRGDRPAD